MLNLECYLCCTIHLYILHYQSYPQNRLEHYTTIATQNLSQFPMNESIQSGHIPPVHTLHLASSISVYAMYSWMQWLASVKPSNMCWHSASRTIQKTRKVKDTICTLRTSECPEMTCTIQTEGWCNSKMQPKSSSLVRSWSYTKANCIPHTAGPTIVQKTNTSHSYKFYSNITQVPSTWDAYSLCQKTAKDPIKPVIF
jgi:hypothetical protein